MPPKHLTSHGVSPVPRHRVEPYVVAADIASAHPYTGRGGWTWYTGSAAWTYRAAVEGVLGLRLSNGRLRIEPCLPPTWPGYKAVVRTGGGTVEIDVDNAQGGGCGVADISIDGRPFDGQTVELPRGGEQLRVAGAACARRRRAPCERLSGPRCC